MDVLKNFILSPFKSKNISAPIEEDSSADDEVNNKQLATASTVSVFPERTAKRKAAAKTNVKTRKPAASTKRVVAKKKPSRATSASATAKKKHPVKVKLEPARRSRRSKEYKKGSLSEKVLVTKAWKGSGSRDDPLVLIRH